MGKAKPVKKAPQSPLKISTSLFQRKSKTSQGAGQIDREASTPSSSKGGKGKGSTSNTKGKQSKKESLTGGKTPSKSTTTKGKDVSATTSKKSTSPSSTKQKAGAGKKAQEKRSSSPVETKSGKEKASNSSSSKKGKTGAGGKNSVTPVKAAAKGKVAKQTSSLSDGEKSKGTSNTKRVASEKGRSRESREDKSPSPSRRRSPELEKITTRKRSKSDSESPPPQKVAKVGAKGSKSNKTSKKESAQKKSSATTTKDVAKKVAKKAVASIVASKKKTVVKSEKSAASNNKSNSSSSSTTTTTTKAKDSKDKKKGGDAKKKPAKTVKVKPKAKPRTKIKLKRMASLNAKAILEASFSFEPSEKKQRSPAPSSSSQKAKNSEEPPAVVMKDVAVQDTKPSISNTTLSPSKSEPKMKDAAISVSVSTSTSPTPPEIPEPTQIVKTPKSTPAPVKTGGEKKRKSNDASNNRRESTSSSKGSGKDTQTASFTSPNNLISVGTSTTTTVKTPTKQEKTAGKASSRRSSATGTSVSSDASTSTSTPAKGKDKEKGGKSSNPKKKQKMVAAATTTTSTTSTSTSTSPIPMWNECDKAVEKRAPIAAPVPKQKKNRSNSSGGGRDKVQDSSSQVQQGQLSHHSTSSSSKHKSASYQAKDKPSTPVALYGSGTVYQPAGPLIEPHKQSSVPAGILPETVRLPPDLKVTYQTHPPSSAFVASPETQTKTSSSSSKSHKSSSSSSSTSTHKSSEKSAGTILHQPYKSTTSSSSHASPSPSLSRTIPSSYSSGSGYASSSAGTPLLSPSDPSLSASHHHHHHHLQAPTATVSVASVHGAQLGSVSAGSGSLSMTAHHPHHSLNPGGSIAVGGSQTQNSGAPSSSGMFYTTNYGPHHSPFAPCKYPIVPPDTYRTQSPFQNSFLCPPTTPQPSQSYFMTPFYTPPLTPNPTPGIGTVGPTQPRPLSLSSAVSHQAAAAAAAAYYQQGGPLSQPPPSAAAHLPTSYYMPSPQHHSIHPTPAPGHAGPFRPNQSSQPACPCPTESYQLNSNCTNSNIRPPPLLQRPSPSSGSLPAPEVGANNKHHKPQSTSPALVSATASRPSRSNKEMSLQHPPTCITPAVAADPPVGIHNVIPNSGDGQQAQARHLESAKTFTEQYSLPDDITITPIMPPNSNMNKVLLMLNSSVSVIPTSAPSNTTTTVSANKTSNAHDGLLKLNNSSNHLPSKPKEKDIVHVIDPRSGQRTTIAKHISNNSSRIAGNLSDNNKTKAHMGKNSTPIGEVGKPKSASRMETVRKLNPDLDVIVINRGDLSRSDKIENIQTMDLSTGGGGGGGLPDKPPRVGNQGLKPMPPLKPGRVASNKLHPVPFSAISSSVMGITPGSNHHHHQQGNKRVALAHNDNNFHRNGNETGSGNNSILKVNQKRSKAHSNNSVPIHGNTSVQSALPHSAARSTPKHNQAVATSMGIPFSMPILPPGISISAGNDALDDMQPTNLSKKSYGNMNFQSANNRPVQVNQAYLNPSGIIQQKAKAIKRSLNECIDGLQLQHQQKKLKIMEQHSNGGNRMHVFGNGSPPASSSSSSSARTGIYNVNGGKPTFPQSLPHQQQIERQRQHIASFNKSRPIPQIPVFGRETATAARVRDPDFELKLGGMLINSNDAVNAVSALVVEPFDYSFAIRQSAHNGLGRKGKVNSKPSTMPSYAFTEAKKKVTKFKARHAEKGPGRSSAVSKSKIRTRLSVRPKGLHGNSQQPLGSRSRSRLLRKRSLLCNPNASTSRKSESDSSVCASRSSSTVRIISGVGQNGVKAGKDRDRDKPRNTQAFINATADLYQYRRSVILRVPSPKPMSSAALNFNRTAGADAIARMGNVSPPPPPEASRPDADKTKGEIPRELAAHQMAQLARTHIMMVNQPAIQAQESKGPAGIPRFPSGSMVVNALKKRAGLKPLSPASVNGALSQQLLLNARRQPKWSNGWRFEGEPYEGKIYVKNDDTPMTRKCYPSMRHDGGDIIRTRDCVLLKSGPRKNDLPFIAKIAALWENPGDGEMMFSLLWYYRPEHTELGRTKDDMMDEIFASKHRDTNSVATIEDRCYVLTFNEYCRYRKRLKQLEQGIPDSTLVPFADSAMINSNAAAKIAEAVWNGICDPSITTAQGKVSPEVVFFCRKVYDFRQKRILKNPS